LFWIFALSLIWFGFMFVACSFLQQLIRFIFHKIWSNMSFVVFKFMFALIMQPPCFAMFLFCVIHHPYHCALCHVLHSGSSFTFFLCSLYSSSCCSLFKVCIFFLYILLFYLFFRFHCVFMFLVGSHCRIGQHCCYETIKTILLAQFFWLLIWTQNLLILYHYKWILHSHLLVLQMMRYCFLFMKTHVLDVFEKMNDLIIHNYILSCVYDVISN
jgi:hypothetical protein